MNQKGFSSLGLLAIAVIVLIIGGGAYYVMQQSQPAEMPNYQEQTYTPPVTNKASTNTTTNTSAQAPKTTEPTPKTTTSATNEKTYTNTEHSFSVTYPTDVSLSLSNPGRFLNGSASFSVGVNTGQTNFGRLDIGFPLPPERCDVPKTDASHTAPIDLRYESIGGISFAVYTNTSAPLSANYVEKIYQGLRGNECYFFTETITSDSAASQSQLMIKLDAVAHSFRFTQ